MRANSQAKCAYICSSLVLLFFRNKEDIWCPFPAYDDCNSLGQVELLGTCSFLAAERSGLSAFLLPLDQKCFWFHTPFAMKSSILLASRSDVFPTFAEGLDDFLKSPWGWLGISGAKRLKWCLYIWRCDNGGLFASTAELWWASRDKANWTRSFLQWVTRRSNSQYSPRIVQYKRLSLNPVYPGPQGSPSDENKSERITVGEVKILFSLALLVFLE